MFHSVVLTAILAATASAHILFTYPGTRGNNLITNETFPYGMQWEFPCGGISTTKNRTYWPTSGGSVAFQPGWFQGHFVANIYVNLGFGTDGPFDGPPNMANPMVSPFQILGPSNSPYPGTICLTQLPMPKGHTSKPGDLATIQIVEHAQHGAALYACVDIEFAEPGDPRIPIVNESNCFNSQEIGFADIYTITTHEPIRDDGIDEQTSGGEAVSFWYFGRNRQFSSWRVVGWLPVVVGGLWVFL